MTQNAPKILELGMNLGNLSSSILNSDWQEASDSLDVIESLLKELFNISATPNGIAAQLRSAINTQNQDSAVALSDSLTNSIKVTVEKFVVA